MTKKSSRRRDSGLTDKQHRFVLEYLVDSNASAAARRAGFSLKTAGKQAVQLMAKPSIQLEIKKRQHKVEGKLEITADRIAAELALLAFSNLADYIEVRELAGFEDRASVNWSKLKDRRLAAAVQEFDCENESIRLADKRAALVDLAKMLGHWKERAPESEKEPLNELLYRVFNANGGAAIKS